jgi:hypothetical protein
MDDTFRFPLTCPRCGTESLMAYRTVAVTIAVKDWHSMRLYTPCHDIFWDASVLELDQIDAYLGASRLGAIAMGSVCLPG